MYVGRSRSCDHGGGLWVSDKSIAPIHNELDVTNNRLEQLDSKIRHVTSELAYLGTNVKTIMMLLHNQLSTGDDSCSTGSSSAVNGKTRCQRHGDGVTVLDSGFLDAARLIPAGKYATHNSSSAGSLCPTRPGPKDALPSNTRTSPSAPVAVTVSGCSTASSRSSLASSAAHGAPSVSHSRLPQQSGGTGSSRLRINRVREEADEQMRALCSSNCRRVSLPSALATAGTQQL